MMSLLLVRKIVELFIVLVAGYVATRAGLLRTQDAQGLSAITLFLITPASLLTSFQVDLTGRLQPGDNEIAVQNVMRMASGKK